jgi:hypothetical protein
VTDTTTTTVVPELSLASTTAGPKDKVAAAASEVTNAPPARIIRTRRVGISPGCACGSPRPGMGANGGNRLSNTCGLCAMRSPTETASGVARFAPPTILGAPLVVIAVYGAVAFAFVRWGYPYEVA